MFCRCMIYILEGNHSKQASTLGAHKLQPTQEENAKEVGRSHSKQHVLVFQTPLIPHLRSRQTSTVQLA